MAVGRKGAMEQIRRAELEIKALQLRKAGASLRAIGDQLGISRQTACDYVNAALAELAAEMRAEAQELRALEAARLDDLQVAVWQKARAGDLEAVKTALRILERRARLLGLDLQPGALLPGDMEIILRWHDDNRGIIDVTPPAVDDHPAAALPEPGDDRSAPGAVSYRVRWATMGQEPAGGDAEPEDSA
jgi:hypothetical protein